MINCVTCGTKLGRWQKKYCSPECDYAGRRGATKAPRVPLITYICKHCGKAFEDRHHGYKTGRLFFSRRCANLARPGDRTFVLGRDGYVRYSRDGIIQLQHRRVMEQMLGRKLLRQESVHHKNGVRHDNRPKNLELWSSNHGSGQRITDLPPAPMTTCGFISGMLSVGA